MTVVLGCLVVVDPDFLSEKDVDLGRVLDLFTPEPLDDDVDEVFDLGVDVDLLVDADLEVPPLLVCAKASDWNAVSANAISATAIDVLIVFIKKKFTVNRYGISATRHGKNLHLSANNR